MGDEYGIPDFGFGSLGGSDGGYGGGFGGLFGMSPEDQIPPAPDFGTPSFGTDTGAASSPSFNLGGIGDMSTPSPGAKPDAPWWQGPLGVAGIQGVAAGVGGLFKANADKQNLAQSFAYAEKLQQEAEAAKLQEAQLMAGAQVAAASKMAGAEVAAANLAARAKKFGDVATTYQSYANGIRQSASTSANAFQNLAGIMQAPMLARSNR